jgi:plastocyanin
MGLPLLVKVFAAAIGMAMLIGARTAAAAALHASVKDQHGKPVADTVVSATPLDANNALRAKPPAVVIDQVDKQFVAYVTPVYVGSRVRFPNNDNVRHQVYSFSPAKRFDLPLYAGTDAPPVLFDKPGVVVLGCNIHDWMIGYIYVSETPFFAKTGSAGTAPLEDMPSGDYLVKIWHPRMEQTEEATSRRVTLSAGTPVNLEWQLTLKPTFRIPRVSGAASPGYP